MPSTLDRTLAISAADVRVRLVEGGAEISTAGDSALSPTLRRGRGMRIGEVAMVVVDAADEFATNQTWGAEISKVQAAAIDGGARRWLGAGGGSLRTATAEVSGMRGAGVRVRFRPDSAAMTKAQGFIGAIGERLNDMTFLQPGLSFVLEDDRDSIISDADEVISDFAKAASLAVPVPRFKPRVLMATDEGLTGLVRFMSRTKTPFEWDVIAFRGLEAGRKLEVAMQWNSGFSADVRCYINGVHASALGGVHQSGFRNAVAAVINRYGRERKLIGRTIMGQTIVEVGADDVSEGLAAVIRLQIDSPQFEVKQGPSATSRPEVVGAEIGKFVRQVCDESLTSWFGAHPTDATAIVWKVSSAHETRNTPQRSNCHDFGQRQSGDE